VRFNHFPFLCCFVGNNKCKCCLCRLLFWVEIILILHNIECLFFLCCFSCCFAPLFTNISKECHSHQKINTQKTISIFKNFTCLHFSLKYFSFYKNIQHRCYIIKIYFMLVSFFFWFHYINDAHFWHYVVSDVCKMMRNVKCHKTLSKVCVLNKKMRWIRNFIRINDLLKESCENIRLNVSIRC
jgi:hypothetical protein